MPVKVIYQKPTGQAKSASKGDGYQAPTGTKPPHIPVKQVQPAPQAKKEDKPAS